MNAETLVLDGGGAVDAASYAKATLNILDDFGEERARQGDSQRAVLNILEDIGAETIRLESTQKALLNILDDFDVEKRRVEETNVSLQERTAELGRSNAELEMFAYVASHDLQEPLRMITSYTQLLAKRYRGQLDSDADEFIEFVVDGAMRMSSLINDVLNYSRVGSRDLVLSQTNCEEVLERVLMNLRQRVEATGVVVTHDPLPTVVADSSQLEQLLQNLVDNAIKFCTKKSPAVHIGAHPDSDGWTLFVHDNGIGVDPSYNERIFQAFQRLHSREYPGTGIGLAICKKIVERHDGRLWIESQPDIGSTFSFRLPNKQASTQP
jgi:light-regulated signal transduction histidine kinase (bacteriophytochrome)